MSDSSLDDPWLEPYLTDEENLPIRQLNKPKPNPLVAKVGGRPTASMEHKWVSEVRNDVVNVDFSSLLNSLGYQEKYDEARQSLDPAIVRVARKISARRVLEDFWFDPDNGTRRKLVRFIDRYFHFIVDEVIPLDIVSYNVINHDWRPIYDTKLTPGLIMSYPDHGFGDENNRMTIMLEDIYMPVVISGHGTVPRSSEDKDLARMCACVRAMWAVQFVRAFIPALYIDDYFNVTLYVFARGRISRAKLGSLEDRNRSSLGELVARLAFLFMQPGRFGRFCEWSNNYPYMKIAHQNQESAQPSIQSLYAQPVNIGCDFSGRELRTDYVLKIPLRAPGDAAIHGPLDTLLLSDWIYNRKLVLFSWYPVTSPTWGDVDGVLETQTSALIPTIVDRGIVLEDFFGYRLEFLVFEYDGKSTDPLMRELRRLRDGGAVQKRKRKRRRS
ncbi:hypothetical protein FBU59_002819 [Linderina macrospora]|uniref:Uncharacterized protein n=1 Tax=Linderina macrospora TaxID=4868 RepID=A0ACC1JA23_9FUNG|nr:hypothetical protein FBU59_002819 [Linderina macrospora]